MKQRVTYLQPEGTGIDRNIVHVNPDSLIFTNSKNAALEKRVTAGLSELPAEITDVLKSIHELHIRWSSPRNDALPSPLVSKLPAGLHVFYTPLHADKELDLCSLIKNLFGENLHCHSVSESFSRPPILSERFSSSSSYQYFQVLHDLKAFQHFVEKKLSAPNLKLGLAVSNEADAIQRASHLDLDFDAISHAVTATVAWKADADWKEPLDHPNTARVIVKLREQDRVEVGVLQGEKAEEPEELSLGGYLSVLGEDDEPKGTMFSFPSRHHSLAASQPAQNFKASFQHPTGLHPKLDLTFPSANTLTPPQNSCALHAYLTLPTPIFIDRYQFSDPLFLASQNLLSLRSLSGEQDLEAPTWVLKSWGSAALFELVHPNATTIPSSSSDAPWTVTIPTHLRYVSAATGSDNLKLTHASFDLPTPVVFWACQAEEGLKFRVNPFDRENLGYDGLFGPKTLFYHVPGASVNGTAVGETDGIMSLNVPILDPSRASWVSAATAVVVLLGFAWVGWKLFGARARSGGKVEGEKKRQ